MSKEFIEHLQQHDWKGNIRELKNIIERAVILANGPELTLKIFRWIYRLVILILKRMHHHSILPAVEKSHIQKVLLYTKGNKTEAAKLLNIGLNDFVQEDRRIWFIVIISLPF